MSTTVLTEDTAMVVATDRPRLSWGICAAGAIAAVATSFFLLLLGSGVGFSLASRGSSPAVMVTLGAVYFFASEAFGFAVGGYLVGRLIGPEMENIKEEEFHAAAHGFVMWSLAVVIGIVLAIAAPALSGSAVAGAGLAQSGNSGIAGYWTDSLFQGAPNTAPVLADKAQASRLLLRAGREPLNDDDRQALADTISRDTSVSGGTALTRVRDGEVRFRQALENARKASAIFALWTAFSLLFGAIVAVAAAIAARWMDDKISFSLAPRR